MNCAQTGITSLDVSQNTNLAYLSSWQTGIKELDVSNNTALEVLYLREIDVASLDVSKNTQLQHLDFAQTAITAFDVSNNQKLEQMISNDSLTEFTNMKGHTIKLEKSEHGRAQLLVEDIKTGTVTVFAEADKGYSFAKWNGLPDGVSQTTSSVSFEVKEDMNVSAQFALDSPKTQDNTNMSVCLGLAVLCLAGLGACVIMLRRKEV